ncbi:flippase [Patescibacteria group bacterium]|nr:flippase [Patescibacteria group bacterium]
MTVTTKIAQNTVVQIIGRGIAVGIALITLAITTRYLGTDGYGAYITIIAFIQIFSILADLGIQMTSVQSISESGVDESKILSNIFSLRVFTASIALILTPIIIFLFPYPIMIKIGVLIAAIAFFIAGLSSVFTGVFLKKLLMGRFTLTDIVQKVITLIVVILAVYFNLGLYGILLALIIANLFQFLLLFSFSQKLIKITWQIDFLIWKKILSKSLPIVTTIALNLLYFKGDTVILSLFRSQQEVGLYGAPYRVLEVLINLIYLFLGLLLPLMTLYYTNKNWEALKKIIQLGYDIITLISFPLIVGGLFVGPKLMSFIAGENYLISGHILKILIPATIAIFFAAIFGYLIVAANQQKRVIKFYVANAIISLTLYLIFIPKYGYWAAAIITVFSELFILFSAIYVAQKIYRFKADLSLTKKSFLASMAMAIALYFVVDLHVLFSMSIGASVYLVILYLLKGFSKEMIKEIMSFKKTPTN